MILDTNILLRLIDGEDGPQHAEVKAKLEGALEQGQRLRVDVATIHEVVYVLRSKATGYGYSRTEVADAVQALIRAPELSVERPDALYRGPSRHTPTRRQVAQKSQHRVARLAHLENHPLPGARAPRT